MTKQQNITLSKRVFMIFQAIDPRKPSRPQEYIPAIGTGFGILKQGIVLTAHHVIKSVPKNQLFVGSTFYSPLLIYKIDKVIKHPKADVSALIIKAEKEKPLEYFKIGKPPHGFDDFPLAEDVLSYGFPIMPNEKPIHPRMMKGHIQKQYLYKDTEYCYQAYELGFPAFHGQSGSPVFPDFQKRDTVIGIVTRSISFSSEQGNTSANASWAIGASLISIQDWIESL